LVAFTGLVNDIPVIAEKIPISTSAQITARKFNTNFTLVDPAAADYLVYIVNPDYSAVKKLMITGIYIDTDVKVNAGATMALVDQEKTGAQDSKVIFNAIFYKSCFLDFTTAPLEFMGYMVLVNSANVTGTVSLTLNGYWEEK
jgi:hypothetical protein